MKKANPYKTIAFNLGGIFMVVGAAIYIMPELATYASICFAIGALIFAIIQITTSYDGNNLIVKRLRRQQLFSDILLIISACLLIMNVWEFGYRTGDFWKLSLTIAAILQLYTAFRIPAELKKEK